MQNEEEQKQKPQQLNFEADVNAIYSQLKRFKETYSKKQFYLTMQIYQLYVGLQFNLEHNDLKISKNPWEELKIALLEGRLKSVFLTSAKPDASRIEPHLNCKVRWWPPIHASLTQYAITTEGMDVAVHGSAEAQRQEGTPLVSLAGDAIPPPVPVRKSNGRLLIASQSGYRQLVQRLLECLLGYLLADHVRDEVTRELFEDIYVRPNVVFNILQHLGFETFWLDKWHTEGEFMGAYEASDVYKFMHADNKDKGIPKSLWEQVITLKTHQNRVDYIVQWYQQYEALEHKYVQVCQMDLDDKLKDELVTHRFSDFQRKQRKLLA
jgi:hypothetical protein